MKSEPQPVDKGRTAHERFVEFGKRVLAVPKQEVETREKKWREKKRRRKHA